MPPVRRVGAASKVQKGSSKGQTEWDLVLVIAEEERKFDVKRQRNSCEDIKADVDGLGLQTCQVGPIDAGLISEVLLGPAAFFSKLSDFLSDPVTNLLALFFHGKAPPGNEIRENGVLSTIKSYSESLSARYRKSRRSLKNCLPVKEIETHLAKGPAKLRG